MSDWALVKATMHALAEMVTREDTMHFETHVTHCLDGRCDNPDCPFGDALVLMREIVARINTAPELAPLMGVVEQAIDAREVMCVTGRDKDGTIYVDQLDGRKFRIKIDQINRDEDV